MTSKVLIHCQPEYNSSLKELGIKFIDNVDELTAIVDDISYEVVDGIYQDPDVQLVEHYGIDYDYVNCIEGV